VVVPMVSIDVLGIMALLFATAISPTLGLAAGSLLDPLMHWTIDLVRVFGASSQSLASFGMLRGSDWGWAAVISLYGIMVLAGFAIANRWARRAAIFSLLSLTVLGLTVVTAAQFATPREQLVVTRVPGGIAGIRYSTGSGVADVIISGLAEKEYPIDERVIAPLLKAKGVTKLQKLILLGASFGALDDIVRLGQSYQADSIYLPLRLEHSFKDACHLAGLDTIAGGNISYFGAGTLDSAKPGYYLSTGSVLLRMQESEYRFVRSGDPREIQSQSHSGETIITGSTLAAGESGWGLVREIGAKALVCARIAQAKGENGGKGLVDWADRAGCPIYDLSTQSELVLPPGN
jgi:hypothetical protein